MRKLAILFVTVVFFGILGVAGNLECYYKLEDCKVISEKNDTIIIEDRRGEQWEWEKDGECLHVGDTVTMKMDNNGTDGNHYDDIIEKIEKQ